MQNSLEDHTVSSSLEMEKLADAIMINKLPSRGNLELSRSTKIQLSIVKYLFLILKLRRLMNCQNFRNKI